MKLYLLGVLCLFPTSIVHCSPIEDAAVSRNHTNLKNFLNWSRDFAEVIEKQKQNYRTYLSVFCDMFGHNQYNDIAESLFTFVAKSAELRDLLVKDNAFYVVPGDSTHGDDVAIIYFVMTMKQVIDDLRINIADWEGPLKILSAIKRVKHYKPLKWFQEHGFNETMLHNVTIAQLKHAVDEMSDFGRSIDRLSQFFSTIFFHQPDPRSTPELSWFLILGAYNDHFSRPDLYVKEEYSMVKPVLLNELVKQLREAGAPESSLEMLRLTNVKNELHQDEGCPLNEEIIMDEKVGMFLSLLVSLCENVEGKLRRLEICLRGVFKDSATSDSEKETFVFEVATMKLKWFANTVAALITEDTTMTKACNAVTKYASSISQMYPLDPMRGHMSK